MARPVTLSELISSLKDDLLRLTKFPKTVTDELSVLICCTKQVSVLLSGKETMNVSPIFFIETMSINDLLFTEISLSVACALKAVFKTKDTEKRVRSSFVLIGRKFRLA